MKRNSPKSHEHAALSTVDFADHDGRATLTSELPKPTDEPIQKRTTWREKIGNVLASRHIGKNVGATALAAAELLNASPAYAEFKDIVVIDAAGNEVTFELNASSTCQKNLEDGTYTAGSYVDTKNTTEKSIKITWTAPESAGGASNRVTLPPNLRVQLRVGGNDLKAPANYGKYDIVLSDGTATTGFLGYGNIVCSEDGRAVLRDTEQPGPPPDEDIGGAETAPFDVIAGATRIETAVAVAQEFFLGGTETVVLARADDFPDAIAGTPLADELGAPTLLTQTSELPQATIDELVRLGAKNVVLLGGEAAISADVEQQLKDMGIAIERFAGDNRFGTAVALANTMQNKNAEIVYVASGNTFNDALAAAPTAAKANIPLLLTDAASTTLSPETAAYLAENQDSIRYVVVLGNIPETVEQQIMTAATATSTRVPEQMTADKYGITSAISEFGIGATGLLDSELTVFIATGEDFPDALAIGNAVAATEGGILIMVNGKDGADAGSAYSLIRKITSENGVNQIYFVGGENAVGGGARANAITATAK